MSNFNHNPSGVRRQAHRFLAAALTILGLSIGLASSAHAYTFTVTNTSDDDGTGACADGGACSLRQAINSAESQPGADLINFDASVFSTPQTITQSSRMSDIHQNLTIVGPTAKLTLQGNYGDGYGLVCRAAALSVSNLTFSGYTHTCPN